MPVTQLMERCHANTLPARHTTSAWWRVVCLALTPLAPLLAQSVNRARATIAVGANVHVSKARSDVPHYENIAAGDPVHAGRMISCIHVYTRVGPYIFDQQCYTTFDGGKNWEPTLRVAEGYGQGDPVEAYGRGDTVYVVSLIVGDTAMPDSTAIRNRKTNVYRSVDGGRVFELTARFAFIDREFIVVDRTNGKYAGRVYVAGSNNLSGLDGQSLGAIQIYRSSDGGKTFLGPGIAASADGAGGGFKSGTAAVLSDGTLIALISVSRPGRTQNDDPRLGPNSEMRVVTSTDGGETFTRSVTVAPFFSDRRRSEGGVVGQLVADAGSMAFKDRVYAVWPAVVQDRIQVQFAYSVDKGRTWSRAAVVNDDRNPAETTSGPDHILPAVGVNKDGVVLVTWYDRRESGDNLGWRLRGAVSLDGGETFSASVPIASAANAYPPTTAWDIETRTSSGPAGSVLSAAIEPFFIAGGHTTGMAVDASGAFFPTWVDNRTGVAQLWTAPVTVSGVVAKHGSPDLAALDEVSSQVKIEVVKRTFDQRTGMLSMRVRLRNASKDTVVAPLKIRVRTLESQLGVAEVTAADNGEKGTGAVWDLSSLLQGGVLLPGMRSQERTLEFRIASLRPLKPGRPFLSGVMSADLGLYGKVKKGR
jgi:hypothetical protein